MGNFKVIHGPGQQQNTCELKLRSWVAEAVIFCTDLHDFRTYVNSYIKESPRVNQMYFEDLYKVDFDATYKQLEIWHLNVHGECDRLVVTIKMDR